MDTLMPCVDMRGIGRVSYMNPTFWGVLGPGFLIQVPNAYPISTVGFGRIVTARNVVCACTCVGGGDGQGNASCTCTCMCTHTTTILHACTFMYITLCRECEQCNLYFTHMYKIVHEGTREHLHAACVASQLANSGYYHN